jgi:hypothetical protein
MTEWTSAPKELRLTACINHRKRSVFNDRGREFERSYREVNQRTSPSREKEETTDCGAFGK